MLIVIIRIKWPLKCSSVISSKLKDIHLYVFISKALRLFNSAKQYSASTPSIANKYI